jgi:hypothetical protein
MPAFSTLIRSDPVTYTARLGEESVSVTFDAAKMTGRWERELFSARADGNGVRVSDLILGVFIGWDVTDDAGLPVPLTAEILLDLPQKALVNMIDGMMKANTPASEEGNDSANTSSTVATDSISLPASPQNGQQPSVSPPLSTSLSPT